MINAEGLAAYSALGAPALIYEADTMTITQPRVAKEMHADAQVWKQAAEMLRRQMETSTVRQPEPNNSGTDRRDERGKVTASTL